MNFQKIKILFVLLSAFMDISAQTILVDVDAVRNSRVCTFNPGSQSCRKALEDAITNNVRLACVNQYKNKYSNEAECFLNEGKDIKNNVELYVWGKQNRVFAEIKMIEKELYALKTERLKKLTSSVPSSFNGVCSLEWNLNDRDAKFTRTYLNFSDATNELNFLGKSVQINAGAPIKSYYQKSSDGGISRSNLSFNLYGQFEKGVLNDAVPFFNINGKNFYMLGGNIDMTDRAIEKGLNLIVQISLIESSRAEKYTSLNTGFGSNRVIAIDISGWMEIQCSNYNADPQEEALKSRLELLYKERNQTRVN